MIENHRDLMVREYMMKNMVSVIEFHPTIPIGTLIEPLVKQLHATQGTTYLPNLFDFEFFVSLARHGKLQLKHGILMMDLCAKVYLNDIDWASACQVPFLLIASRFMDHIPTREFLKQFFKIAFEELPSLEKGAKVKLKNAPEYSDEEIDNENKLPIYDKNTPNNVIKTMPPMQRPPEDHRIADANRKIKRAYIIEIAQKVLEMRHYGISDDLKTQILETNRVNFDQHKRNNKGLMKLLEFFGNPEDIIEQYMYDYDKEAREAELQRRQEQNEMEKLTQKNKASSRRRSIESYNDSLLRGSNSDLSSLNSRFSNKKPFELPGQKYLRESRSEFTLMNKPQPIKAKDKFRNIQSRGSKERMKVSRNSKRGGKGSNKLITSNINRKAAMLPINKAMLSPELQGSSMHVPYPGMSEPDSDLLSTPSSSSSETTRFPAIKNASKRRQQLSETKSKSSMNSLYKPSRGYSKGHETDLDYRKGDGTMSVSQLKQK